MMKLISTLSTHLRYSACLFIFVALTACGDDESATGETTPTAETLAAPGSSCSCDDDCASVEGHTGFCYESICLVESDTTNLNRCDKEGTDTNCPTGFICWDGICSPNCYSYDCDGICYGGFCVPASGAACDSSCSRHC